MLILAYLLTQDGQISQVSLGNPRNAQAHARSKFAMATFLSLAICTGARDMPVSDAFGGNEFCTGDENITSCALYLHQELRLMGLPSVLDKDSQLNIPQLLNTTHRLMQLHHSRNMAMEELRTCLQRGRSDVTMQVEIGERLKDDLRVANKALTASQERERQVTIKNKSLSVKLRAEQDEVRRLKASLQYKEAQYSHEVRKREKEYTRLKATLGQMVSDRNHERRLGMSVLNTLHRTGKRKLWDQPGSSVEGTYRAIVSSYEERQKAMLVENASLRESLAVIQRELVSLLNEQQRRRDRKPMVEGREEEEEEEGGELGPLTSGHFQMPYDIVRDGIEKTFREHLQRLREQLQLVSSTSQPQGEGGGEEEGEGERGGGGEEEGEGPEGVDVTALQNQLSDYRDIIGKQEELLQKTASNSEGSRGCLSESWLWREKDVLREDKAELQEHRENLEKERQLVVEAAKKLDRERQTFEDDKVAFLKEQFLDSSVFNSTSELDSFYSRLSSTPAASSGSSARVDLNSDLSLCSDDGSPDVLNEDKPDHH